MSARMHNYDTVYVRDANASLKDLLKVSEDDERRAQDEIQKLTDKYVAEVDKLFAQKETELMAI